MTRNESIIENTLIMEDKDKNINGKSETGEDSRLHQDAEKILTREEEIETEWANVLHLDYDPEEARRRAEQAAPATPPPFPQSFSQQPPAPQPFGQQPPAPHMEMSGHTEPMPETYLVWSVLATVLCCLIPGVVAIVYSTMVSSRYYAKDYEGARRASEKAQYWIIASVVLGVITAAVYLPLSLFA